jgi:hypothetical protein
VDFRLNTLLPEWQPAADIELGDEIDPLVNDLDAAAGSFPRIRSNGPTEPKRICWHLNR